MSFDFFVAGRLQHGVVILRTVLALRRYTYQQKTKSVAGGD